MVDFLSKYKKEKKPIASDILVILVVVKFSFEYIMIYQSELTAFLAAIFIFAGILALAMRIRIFRDLLSIAAIIFFSHRLII